MSSKHIPLRTCLATGQKFAQTQLLRFVNQGGELMPDPAHKLPGRGAYITPTEAAYAQACRKKAFHHRLKITSAPPSWQSIAQLLDKTPIQGHKAAEIEG